MTTPNKAPADLAAKLLDILRADKYPLMRSFALSVEEWEALLSAASASLPLADGEVAELIARGDKARLLDKGTIISAVFYADWPKIRSLLLRQSAALKEAEAEVKAMETIADERRDRAKQAESRVREMEGVLSRSENHSRRQAEAFDALSALSTKLGNPALEPRDGESFSAALIRFAVERAALSGASSAPAKPEMPECVRNFIDAAHGASERHNGCGMGECSVCELNECLAAVEAYYAPASAAGKETK